MAKDDVWVECPDCDVIQGLYCLGHRPPSARAEQPYRGQSFTHMWIDEADELPEFPPGYIEQLTRDAERPLHLTQGNFDAMDETMDFQFKPARELPSLLDTPCDTADIIRQKLARCAPSARSEHAQARSEYAMHDALDHSLKDQGSWYARWLNAI